MKNELDRWFLSEFSSDEYSRIALKISVLANGSLTPGGVLPRNYVKHLYIVAGYFINEPIIAERLLQKGVTLINTKTYTSLDKFFLYGESARIFYKNRALASFKVKAIEACAGQIKMAVPMIKVFESTRGFSRCCLPVHNGYNQLTWMLEEDKQYHHAIALCKQALKQGWPADWESRIARCRRLENAYQASRPAAIEAV